MSLPTRIEQTHQYRSSTTRKLARLSNGVGSGILTVLLLLAIFPAAFAPYDPAERVAPPLQKPGANYLLGTNDVGQDLFSELIAGTRASLFVGLIVSALTVSFGTWAGMTAGLLGGWFDSLLMRLSDLVLVLPFLPLVILLSVYLGPSQQNVIIVLSIFFWAIPARLIRARVLGIHSESYMEAARALGANMLQIIVRHCWPGVKPLALTQIVLVASASILAESSLSFLGLGDPSGKSWGTMLYFARASGAFLGDAWKWWVVPAGSMITLTVLSLALLGYSLEQRAADSAA
jgi:ABC-type dipeptide/oligopeptide/nickel transport system permease subunit